MLEQINHLKDKFKGMEVVNNIHVNVKNKGCVLFLWPEINKAQVVLRTKNKNKESIEEVINKYNNEEDNHYLVFQELLQKNIYSEEETVIKICQTES